MRTLRLLHLIRKAALVVALLAFVTGTAMAQQTWYVDDDAGDDNIYNGTSPTISGTSGPFRTVTRAIDVASAGDTIMLEGGAYAAFTVNKNLTFGVYADNGVTVATLAGVTVDNNASANFGQTGAGSFTVAALTLTTGSFNAADGKVTIPAGTTITRANGAVTGTLTFGGLVNVTYTGNGVDAGPELPADLKGGTLTVSFANTGTLNNLPGGSIIVGNVAVNGNSTISGTLVFNANGTVTGGAAANAPGTITNLTVINSATVTVVDEVNFAGLLSLSNGAIVVAGDLSPVGASAAVLVNTANPAQAGPSGVISGNFNSDDQLFDLTYQTPFNTQTGMDGLVINAGTEFDTDNIRNLDIEAENGTIDASARPAGSIEGNVTVRNGDVAAMNNTQTATLILPTAAVTVKGNVVVEENAILTKNTTPLTLQGTANTVSGIINGDSEILVDATGVAITGGSGASQLIDVRVLSTRSATISGIKDIIGDVTVENDASLSLGLVADADPASPGDVTGSIIIGGVGGSGSSLALTSDVEVGGSVTGNNGTVNLGAFDILLITAGQGLTSAQNVSWQATDGEVIFNGASSLNLNGATLPNVRIHNDVTLVTTGAINGSFVQVNVDNDLSGADFTLGGTATIAGGEFFRPGGNTLTAANLAATLASNATVTGNLRVNGGLTLASAGNGASFDLNVAGNLVMDAGALTVGLENVLVSGIIDYNAGTFASTGGFIVASGNIDLAAGATIPYLAIADGANVATVAAEKRTLTVTNTLHLGRGSTFDSDAGSDTQLILANESTLIREPGATLATDATADVIFGSDMTVVYGDGDGNDAMTSGFELPANVRNLTLTDDVTVTSNTTVTGTFYVNGSAFNGTPNANVTLANGSTLVLEGAADLQKALVFPAAGESYNLTYTNYTFAASTSNAEFGENVNVLTINNSAENLLTLHATRTIGSLNITDKGGLTLDGTDLRVTGTVTIDNDGDDGNTPVYLNGSGQLVFAGVADQALVLAGSWAPQVDIHLALEGEVGKTAADTIGAVVRLIGGNLDLAANGQLLFLSKGLLLTGDNVVILQHTGLNNANAIDQGQGFVTDVNAGGDNDDSFIVGNVRKNVTNRPNALAGDLAGNVIFPLGAADGNSRQLVISFGADQNRDHIQTNLTVGYVDEDPQGENGLPIDSLGATITGYPSFYWIVRADPLLSPATNYSIQATAEGYDLGQDEIQDLYLIQRADGDAVRNQWRLIGGQYANFLVDEEGTPSPTVVATGAQSTFNPQGSRITYGLTSSLALLMEIADMELVIDDDPFTITLPNNVFAGGTGEVTFTATSSNPNVASATVDNGVLTVTALGKGQTTITVTARDEANNINRTSFVVTVLTGVATEGTDALPTEFALLGNYPNPFNPTTSIQFDLPETAEVSLVVVDMLGRNVMTIPAQTMQAGAKRSIQVNASNLASGMYLYRLIATSANDTHVMTGRMMLVK